MTDVRFLFPLSLSGPVLLAHFYVAFYVDETLCFCVCCLFSQCGIYKNGTNSDTSHCFHLCLLLTVFKMCANNSKVGFSRFVFLLSTGIVSACLTQNRPTASKPTLRLTERRLPLRFVHKRTNGNIKSDRTVSSNHDNTTIPRYGHPSVAISFKTRDLTTTHPGQSTQ